jgi:3-methyladenine DNA glycosylase AlkC
MALLKDLYSESFYKKLTDALQVVLPGFDAKSFTKEIYSGSFDTMELKQRMRHTTMVMHAFFPPLFSDASKVLVRLVKQLRENEVGEDQLAFMFLPDFIECYGLDDYEDGVEMLEFMTQFVSCEFAVRPFLIKYKDKMMAQMLQWSQHESYKVRRFASEGSRPALPWAMAVPFLKKDPALVLPILENLKNDPSEWVRRSVANNLNDISKIKPEIVLELAGRWKGISKETDAIIKHGCRSLLKQGHADILLHYALESKHIELDHFVISTAVVKIGDSLDFSFSVKNNGPVKQLVRLEYAVYYKRLNGQVSKKVFKISERIFEPEESATINRKQSFRVITTRTFYPGTHRLSVILNGKESILQDFELIL